MPGTSLRLPTRTQLYSAMLGMSRSVQTMTFMPLASVVDLTWSAPGTRGAAGGLVAAVTAPQIRSRQAARKVFGMRHLEMRWVI